MKSVTKWTVKLARAAEADVSEMVSNGTITDDEKEVIRKWAQAIIEGGPEAIRGDDKIFADHDLKGEWVGHRASSFSNRGRLIYRIDGDVVRVTVVRVTSIHDYGKEKK